MTRYGVLAGLGLVLAMGNVGCYLDQLQATQRANGVLREDLSRAQADLQDAQALNKQKDTQIDALGKQLATKDEQVNSLTAENSSLRDALKKAQDILEAQAGKGAGTIAIMRSALPPALNEALKKLAEEYPNLLEFDPKTGVVRWKADLLFPLGSDALSDSSAILEPLKKFADIVNSEKANGFDVIIVGHTCNTPIKKSATLQEHKTNWHLSAHRAIAIMNMLAGQQVSQDRMGVMGYGEHRPIADNASQAGKAKNRRVEIYLVPKGSVQSVSQGVYSSPEMGLAYVMPGDLAK